MIYILVYLLIGVLLTAYMINRKAKLLGIKFKEEANYGGICLFGFVLLWPFGLDFILFD